MSDREAAIREALHPRDEHHDRCDSRRGKPCDCHARRDLPAHEALDALLAELAAAREREAKLREALRSARDVVYVLTGRVWPRGTGNAMSKALRKADAALADGEGET